MVLPLLLAFVDGGDRHPSRRGLGGWGVALCAGALLLLVSGCNCAPLDPDTLYRCDEGACIQRGYECRADGWCHRSDGGASDAGTGDAGTGDAGTGDAGAGDAGAGDAGTSDAGTSDAGKGDAGTTDAGKGDAGAGDAGPKTDAGSGFGYAPSNFNLASVAPGTQGVALSCATAEISSNAGSGGTFKGWCAGSALPLLFDVEQDGGERALVATMPFLSVGAGAQLSLTGPRPIILVVYGDAVVDGRILAPPTGLGAGSSLPSAPKAHCQGGTGGSSTCSNTTSGGGGGGAFATASAPGGKDGDQGNGGLAGAANGLASLVPLRGGCAGGAGGDLASANVGGAGGGAIQLSVAGQLVISGLVGAPGGGGEGGNQATDTCAGAGGGGSGGAVLLEAQQVAVLNGAVISANGGGGGEGDADPGNNLGGGVSGEAGHTSDAVAAAGGRSAAGGVGGDGAAALLGPLAGGNGSGSNLPGGGGGGGSVGRIRIRAEKSGTCLFGGIARACCELLGVVSPPAVTVNCP